MESVLLGAQLPLAIWQSLGHGKGTAFLGPLVVIFLGKGRPLLLEQDGWVTPSFGLDSPFSSLGFELLGGVLPVLNRSLQSLSLQRVSGAKDQAES